MSNPEPVTADVEQARKLLYELFPLYAHIGLIVEQARDGRYCCRLPLADRNGNHLGTMHAALQWALGEVLGGLAVISIFSPERFTELYPAVTSARIEFLRPARSALLAHAELSPEACERIREDTNNTGEARFKLDAELSQEDGSVAARLYGEYIVRPKRQLSSDYGLPE